MIPLSADLLAAFIVAIFGGGGLFAVFLKWLESRRAKPLNEIVSLAEIQKQIRQEVRQENAELRKEISSLRAAMVELTGVIDEILPGLHQLSEEHKDKLRKAHEAAKLAM